MSVTYTIITRSDGEEYRKNITIDDNTTVGEAIKKINLSLGEDDTNKNENSSDKPEKETEHVKKVRTVLFDESSIEENETEPIEIFGLSQYTDRSSKFNKIKFPKNELIVYSIPIDNLLLKSTIMPDRKPV